MIDFAGDAEGGKCQIDYLYRLRRSQMMHTGAQGKIAFRGEILVIAV
jgi:hypothetical protein